jgi:hypothetical protein
VKKKEIRKKRIMPVDWVSKITCFEYFSQKTTMYTKHIETFGIRGHILN